MENPFRRIYNLRKGGRIMEQTVKTFTSEGADARKWIGRIIMAVILGEAIWSLIVSIMNNLVVPWLGDVIGQASGLPTSFTQRPYDYPDVFVSVLEFCIAGDRGGDAQLFPSAAKGGKSEAGEEFGCDRAGRARTSRSSSRGGRSDDPGHVAGRPTSASGEAGPGYPTCTCHASSGSASSICRAGTGSETYGSCSLSAASCELSGEASAVRAKNRATQAEEGQRGLLQHRRRSDTF